MDWFYDKQVTFTIRKDGGLDESTGLFKKGETETFSIPCDVQPVSRGKNFDEIGALIDAEYTIYCDPNALINEHLTVTYNGNDYTILKIVDWDSYLIIYIKAVG